MTTLRVTLPEGATIVSSSLAAAGYDTLVVGGAVRDTLLGRAVTEVDLLTSAPLDDVRDLLSRLPWVEAYWDAGARWGTLGVKALGARIEVTTMGTDPSDDRDLEARFAENAAGRDFTVNAMAVVLPDGFLLDPTGGRRDLEGRTLRAPGDATQRFSDDPLRVMRLSRFVAELGFRPSEATREAAARLAPELVGVSPERIHGELWRTLVAPRASRGIRSLWESGALAVVVPEAQATSTRLATLESLPREADRRLASLLPVDFDPSARCQALRCSRAQARRVRFFLAHGLDADPDRPPVSPIGGNTIIRELGVAPGPMVGAVKSALAQAVADGVLARDDRDGALRMARRVLGIDEVEPKDTAKGDTS